MGPRRVGGGPYPGQGGSVEEQRGKCESERVQRAEDRKLGGTADARRVVAAGGKDLPVAATVHLSGGACVGRASSGNSCGKLLLQTEYSTKHMPK